MNPPALPVKPCPPPPPPVVGIPMLALDSCPHCRRASHATRSSNFCCVYCGKSWAKEYAKYGVDLGQEYEDENQEPPELPKFPDMMYREEAIIPWSPKVIFFGFFGLIILFLAISLYLWTTKQ